MGRPIAASGGSVRIWADRQGKDERVQWRSPHYNSEIRMGGTQRVALVTGGGSGIGAAVAQRLAADGYRVVVAGRRAAELARTASAAPQQISTAVVDVANRGAVEGWIASVLSELGRIDVLVNCAGMNTVRRTVADLSAADWQRVMEVNASGAFHCIQCVLPAMRSRGSGTIINISSVAGIRAVPLGGVAYNASKFAMTADRKSVV